MESVRYPQGRNMATGCTCNTNNRRATNSNSCQSSMQQPTSRTTFPNSCHEHAEHDFEHFPIGMAYVPWQTWGNLYSPEKGLCEGTIFMDLNQIFCGKRGHRA